MQYSFSAVLNRFGTLGLTGKSQGFILSLLLIEDKYERPYCADQLEEDMYFRDVLFYWYPVAKFMVDQAIFQASLAFYAFFWAESPVYPSQQYCSE